jgi:hypothetical protein
MWISAHPFVQNDVFLKVPYILWIWDFIEEEELRVQGLGMNEVSFRARPHHSVHCTLGVDARAIGPL